jgi:predicted CXXCH cytochrome family protein
MTFLPKKCVVRFRSSCQYFLCVERSKLIRWVSGKRERLFWGVGGTAAIALVLLSCSTVGNRTVMAPPTIPGAEFVGSESCETCHEAITKNFRTATHARLKAHGDNAKAMGCESCHGPGSLHVQSGGEPRKIVNPRKSPDACFQCHLEVRAKFELPHHHPVLAGKMSCSDCHNPHAGDAIKGGGTSLPQQVKGGGTVLLGQNGTCLQCHVAQRGPFVFEHEAIREGCVSCHSPHGSVNQRMLNERNATLCLKCHYQQQTQAGRIFIGDSDHTNRLPQGTCWSAGCHEAVHGSQVNAHMRY